MSVITKCLYMNHLNLSLGFEVRLKLACSAAETISYSPVYDCSHKMFVYGSLKFLCCLVQLQRLLSILAILSGMQNLILIVLIRLCGCTG